MTQAWNLSQLGNKVNSSGQLDASTGLVNAASVANGGTGAATLAANNVVLGNGTSAVQLVAPGTSGNVLTSNGTTWASAVVAVNAPYTGFSTVILGSSTTWAVPTGITKARISIIGGGGGGRTASALQALGGNGGVCVAYCTGLSGALTITIGAGGNGASGTGTAGGTTSVTGTGVSMSATGGTASPSSTVNGTKGAGTVTTGTLLSVDNSSVTGIAQGPPLFTQREADSGSTSATGIAFSVNTGKAAGRGGGTITTNSGGCGGAVLIEY